MNKSSLEPKIKDKWKSVMTTETMSSEESDGEDDIIVIKPLSWPKDRVTRFFHQLDEKNLELKSPQARRQRRNRIMSHTSSERPKPDAPTYPPWCFTD